MSFSIPSASATCHFLELKQGLPKAIEAYALHTPQSLCTQEYMFANWRLIIPGLPASLLGIHNVIKQRRVTLHRVTIRSAPRVLIMGWCDSNAVWKYSAVLPSRNEELWYWGLSHLDRTHITSGDSVVINLHHQRALTALLAHGM